MSTEPATVMKNDAESVQARTQFIKPNPKSPQHLIDFAKAKHTGINVHLNETRDDAIMALIEEVQRLSGREPLTVVPVVPTYGVNLNPPTQRDSVRPPKLPDAPRQ